MLWDLTHVVVEEPLCGPKMIVGNDAQPPLHMRDLGGRWLGAMGPPDHHWYVARLTLGDPTGVVFVIPRGEAGGFAEIAVRTHTELLSLAVRFQNFGVGAVGAPTNGWPTGPERLVIDCKRSQGDPMSVHRTQLWSPVAGMPKLFHRSRFRSVRWPSRNRLARPAAK